MVFTSAENNGANYSVISNMLIMNPGSKLHEHVAFSQKRLFFYLKNVKIF